MTSFPLNHLEISASAPKEAAEFYSKVFGWKIEVEETMDYHLFLPEESGIGGAFTEVSEDNPAGTIVPYVTTEDLEASLSTVEANGGKALVPKTEIPGIGWFGVFADPTGNQIGLYQALNPEG